MAVDSNWRWPHLISAGAGETTLPGGRIRLAGSVCSQCDQVAFPAARTCCWCGGAATEATLDESGTVVACTEVLHPTPGASVAPPYGVALVRFANQHLDVMGVMEQGSSARIGDLVEVVAAQPFDSGEHHYAFRRIKGAG